MTVTIEFAPTGVTVPASTRPRSTSRGATVPRRRPVGPVGPARPAGAAPAAQAVPSCLTATGPQPVAASSAVQLTRRGWTVLLSLATAVAAALVWVAFLSHPAATPAATATTTGAGAAPSQVVVQSGDTLWSIASRVAPERDPRAVVFDLQQANHLADSTVVEGQVLRVG